MALTVATPFTMAMAILTVMAVAINIDMTKDTIMTMAMAKNYNLTQIILHYVRIC
jgi:hypothetical protein